MSAYHKAEIEALAQACARHWNGQALDWWLLVEPNLRDAPATVTLQVEIALDCCTRITAITLGNHDNCAPHEHETALAATPPHRSRNDGAAVAAVRRASVQSLLAQSTGGDIGALLGYLRGCGILVMD